MAGTVLWQGFDYGWNIAPHRLNQFGSLLDNFTVAPDGTVGGRYISNLSPGNVPDSADANTYVSSLDGPALHFTDQTVSQSVSGTTGNSATAVGPRVTVALPFPADTAVVATALIRGFDIQSAKGSMHTRGFGFRILNARTSRNVFSFDPEFFIFPDRSPDPLTSDPDDFDYSMSLLYSVVSAPQGQVHFTQGGQSSTANTPKEPTRIQASLIGQGGTAFNRGAIGIRGIRWQIVDAPVQPKGRYLRRLLSFVNDITYDPSSGKAAFASNLWFTNEVLLAEGYVVQYECEQTLIQYSAPAVPVMKVLHNMVAIGESTAAQNFTIGLGYQGGRASG